MADAKFTDRAAVEVWAEMDAWCEKQHGAIAGLTSPHIMKGGSVKDPWFRLMVGQAQAFHRMRSYIAGAKRTPTHAHLEEK